MRRLEMLRSTRSRTLLNHCRSGLFCMIVMCFLLLGGAQRVWAVFTVIFNGVVSILNTGSIILGSPTGVAVDVTGNRYIADTAHNQIVKIDPQGNASVFAISGLSTALSSPAGLAIDGAGNLYIADLGNSRIVEVTPAGSGSAVNTGAVTLSSPRGVAIDASGNLYISDTGHNRIVEVPSGGSAAVVNITGLGTPLSTPAGLAADTFGNVYVADSGNNRIVQVSPGGAGSVVVFGGLTLTGPLSVAVDSQTNLYVADTGNNRVVFRAQNGSNFGVNTGSITLSAPAGIAVDALGAAYVADTGNNQVETLQLNAVGFGRVQLASIAGNTLVLPFRVSSAATVSSVQVFTLGTQNLDFTVLGGSTTCASETTNTTCTVGVTFSPIAPGLRRGAVVLNYTAGASQFSISIPVYGYADAPVPGLAPGVASVLNTGGTSTSEPFQTAIDGAGNMYVVNYGGSNVIKIPAGGGSATVVSTGSVTLNSPTGGALDGAGNLYIADYNNSRIVVVPVSGTPYVLSITGVSPSISFPTALAFDAAGNLYIDDYGNGRIVKVFPSGAGTVLSTAPYTLGSDNATGTAVDQFGNVYVTDQNNNRILKITPAGAVSVLSLPGITLSAPLGVSVDGPGNVYIADSGNLRIVQLTTAGVASVLRFSGPTLGYFVFGITPDASDNLIIADFINNRVLKLDVSAASLKFPTTSVGSTSTSQTATVTNLGDQALTFSANPTYTTNFPQNTSDSNPCTSSTSLAPGTACDVSVKFAPQSAGSLSASITVTDNALNVANSTQQVSVSGTSVTAVAGVAPASLTFTSQNVGTTSAGQTLTLSNTGTAALSIASIAVTGDFAQTNNCGSSLAGSHSCTINITFTPTAAGARTGNLTITDNSNGASGSTQVITLGGTGVAPLAALSGASISFGNQVLGSTSGAQVIMLSNTGSAPLNISGITVTGANSSDFLKTTTCGSSLAASSSCSISISFRPGAAGARSATLMITDNSNGVNGSVQTVSLAGTGGVSCQSTQNDIANSLQSGLITRPATAVALSTILQLACTASAQGNIPLSQLRFRTFKVEITAFSRSGLVQPAAQQLLTADANALISQLP